MAHGYFCLIGGLLTFKRRIDLDCLIATVKLTHMALEAEALIRRTALFLFANHF